MSEPHDFVKSQEIERKWSPMITEILKRAFPFVSEIVPENDPDQQKKGIDKKLTCLFFESGKRMTIEVVIDEKIRPGHDFEDFLIEEWSDKEKGKPGWLNRKMITDYIVVFWVETGRYMIVPFLLLQATYYHNQKEWREKYKIKKNAENKGWTTTNLGIPLNVLFEAMKKEMMGQC